VYRNNKITIPEIEKMRPERIVISPGPCTPKEAGISIDVIKHFAGKVRSSASALATSQSVRLSAATSSARPI